MPDLHYTDPALVEIYDAFNGWSADRDYYLSLPHSRPARVLEVGCGTGLVARALARQGHDVTGLDPARPMLDYGRRRPSGETVTWVCGTLSDCVDQPFDLIFMTGHAFQCLIADAEIETAFVRIRDLLMPDGRFVFETRNPAARVWTRWVPETTRRQLTMSDGGVVTEEHDLVAVAGELVSFTSTYQVGGRKLVSHSTLRFADLARLTALARKAGLAVKMVHGDWDRSVLTPHSPEIIVTLVPS
ncbi:class I SAM-dependent methyltransferase [Yoonia sp. SS1-5]|uniref:Class I SAM-dependent methyltransferase n=1 Tax=Yoonia rhodophyticola TaxID=3137370 RepID=A0AAN0NLV3_9RHOB